jgi:hypothetical protein
MADVVSLTDVKTYIQIPQSDTSNDDLLGFYIAGADQLATFYFGEWGTGTTYTNEVHDGGDTIIALRHVPVLSITSLIEYVGITPYTLTLQPLGATVNNYGYDLIRPSGGIVLRRSAAGTPMSFMGGAGSVVCTYVAGRATVPGDIYLAILDDIKALFEQTQEGGRGPFEAAAEGWSAPPFHLFPKLAALASGSRRIPGIA